MDDAYKRACLVLVGGISRALEQMEERNYGLAEKTLRDAWRQAVGGSDASQNLPLDFSPRR